jgi:hypothetical protein
MRKLKFVFALILGAVLGLLSSCRGTPPPSKPPVPPDKPPAGARTNTVPEKQEDLPVRGPILE